jgi:hypothetical protein
VYLNKQKITTDDEDIDNIVKEDIEDTEAVADENDEENEEMKE